MPEAASTRARCRRGAAVLLPRDGVALFRAALAVVMVAVADDAFIHPEPGVAAGDHLASGLVPLACARAADRLRPPAAGPRARLARDLRRSPLDRRRRNGRRPPHRRRPHERRRRDRRARRVSPESSSSRSVSRRCGAPAARRDPAGGSSAARASARRSSPSIALVVLPTGIAIVATHKARSPVAGVDLGRPHRDVAPDDERRAASARVVRPLAATAPPSSPSPAAPSRSRTRAC